MLEINLDPVRSIKSLRARFAVLLISKIYRQMYADTGNATDSARVSRSATLGTFGLQGHVSAYLPAVQCHTWGVSCE